MSDPRVTPMNARVARADWPDIPDGIAPVAGIEQQITQPIADLRREPGGQRDRQLLFGDRICVLETLAGWSFVQSRKDDYVGYVKSSAFGDITPATHRVQSAATHLYAEPDMKSPERFSLSLGSTLHVLREVGDFLETPNGFVPRTHTCAVDHCAVDPVSVAELLLETPYLWGGNSRFGIDCSGLVQIALHSCGIRCSGDSDMQQNALGTPLPIGTETRRGDLMFWNGHVAWVADQDTILHANAHHMAVRHEPLREAITRIEEQGDGAPTAHIRL